MLVLTRLLGQRIKLTVDGDLVIWIEVVDIDRGKIRLGVDADRDRVKIDREEVARAIDRQKEPRP